MGKEQTDEIKSYLDWAHKSRSAWWLYVIGYFLLSPIFIVGNMWFGILINLIFPGLSNTIAGKIAWAGLSFIPTFVLVPFLTWLLHKRPWWSVAMPKLKLEGWNLGVGFLFAWIMLLASYGLFVLFGGVHMSFQSPDLKIYLPLFIFGLITLFIQGSAEELYFRGYIMQFARRLTSSPMLIILASAILFARPHLSNLDVLGWPSYAIALYLIDGIFVAWLAYRTRSTLCPASYPKHSVAGQWRGSVDDSLCASGNSLRMGRLSLRLTMDGAGAASGE